MKSGARKEVLVVIVDFTVVVLSERDALKTTICFPALS
jgi:hypothetical protein